MSDFTNQQELEIINSPEFAKFLEDRHKAGSDRIGIDDFLEISGNQTKWEKRFAEQQAKQDNKPELTLEEIKQSLDALETTTNSANDSALDEYFENLQKDSHDILNDIVKGERIFAENAYNTPEAYEITKKFIEDMVGGYFETSLGGQNGDVRLKDVHDKALAMLEASRAAYENSNHITNDKQPRNAFMVKEERDVPNMLMVVMDNREAGANHTVADMMSRLDEIDAAAHNLDAARLKRMILAIKQSQKELSNQDILDSFASEEFQEIYNNVRNMPAQERDRRLGTTGFGAFENKINGDNNTFARDRLLALYMLSEVRKHTDHKYSLNNIVQNEADVVVGDFIAKNVYGYDDPVNPTSNGVREPYFTRKMTIEVVGVEPTPDLRPQPAPKPRPEPEPRPEPKPRPKPRPIPTPQPEPISEENDVFYRERSDNSDKNKEKLDKIKVVVLYEMGIINNEVMQAALKNPEKAMETIAKRDMLKGSQQQEFGIKVSEKLLSLDSAYTEVKDADGNVVKDENGNDVRIEITFNDLPPQMLADLYTYVKNKQENIKNNTPDEEKQKIARDFNKVAERIDDLTDQYYSGTAMPIALQTYNYDTETNIADIYDGYTNMFKVRRPDVVKQVEYFDEDSKERRTKVEVDEERQKRIDSCQEKLDREIGEYDEVYGLTSIKKGDATRLSDNADKLSKRMKDMSLSPELISNLGNLKFLDENGQEIPQFDADGKILPDSKLQTLVDFAKNNARIEHIGDKDVSKNALSDETLQDNIDSRFYAVLRAAADEKDIFKTLDETQRNFQDDINTAALMAQLNDPNRPIRITPEMFETIKQDQVNQTIACINRIDKKVGTNGNNYLLPKLHEPIKKYDARASERFSIVDPGKPTTKSWFKTFGLTTTVSVGMKAVAWGGAKLAAYGAKHTTGAISTTLSGITMFQVAGAAAVGLTGFAMYKNMKNFKANNPGVKGWKAFTTAPYASQMLASGLGCAAGVCLMHGNLTAAAVLGGAALTVQGVSEYKNARKLGLSKRESFKRSAHKLTAIVAGAFTGNLLSQQFGMTPDSIKQGEKLEDAEPGKEYHNYSKEEHAHADLRQGPAENHPNDPHTEGSRYSEYYGHDWTESSFNQDTHAIMQENINNGIQGHSQFYTYENGQEISNADVLEYKLHQSHILAEKAISVTDPDVISVTNPDVISVTNPDVISVTDPDGNVVTNSELYHNLQQPDYQMTPTDLDLLLEVENHIGGQIDVLPDGESVPNGFGATDALGEIPNKDGVVLSYVDKVDPGYETIITEGKGAVHAPDEIIKGENPSSVAYIGWVGKAKKKALQLVGAFADKIIPFKRKKENVVKKEEPISQKITHEQSTNIHNDKKIDSQVIQKQTSQTPREQASQVIQKQTSQVVQEQTSQVIQKQTSQIVQEQTSQVIQKQTSQTTLNEMLDKEYQIVHGIKPDEIERARYKQLVQNEWKKENAPSADMGAYMQQRMAEFEKMIGVAKEPLAENYQGMSSKYKEDINAARTRMWQLPHGERGTADVTLTDFRRHMAKCLSNDGQLRAEVSGRQISSKQAPVIGKRGRSK